MRHSIPANMKMKYWPMFVDNIVDDQTKDSCISIELPLENRKAKYLRREPQEPVSKTFERIRLLFYKENTKAESVECKKDNQDVASGRHKKNIKGAHVKSDKDNRLLQCPSAHVFLPDETTEISVETHNQEAFADRNVLKVGDWCWRVRCKVPCVKSLIPPSRLIVGCPCLPLIANSLNVTDPNVDLTWSWSLAAKKQSESDKKGFVQESKYVGDEVKKSVQQSGQDTNQEEHVLSDTMVYVPTEICEGSPLKITVSDPRGHTITKITPVVRSPPHEKRLFKPLVPLSGKSLEKGTYFPDFRVVTYNVLHDSYASSDYARTVLYPHVSDRNIEYNNRELRLGQEIISYSSDVIALQEMGRSTFSNYFRPLFRSLGYEGTHESKTLPPRPALPYQKLESSTRQLMDDGCALLWNKSKFDFIERVTVPLTIDFFDHTAVQGDPQWERILRLIHTHPRVLKALRNVTTCALFVCLRCKESQLENRQATTQNTDVMSVEAKSESGNHPTEIILANTHLFWHPYATHIRALQAYMVAYIISQLRESRLDCLRKNSSNATTPRVGIVLCGDMNNPPDGIVHTLLTEGRVSAEHTDWCDSLIFDWDKTKGGLASLEEIDLDSNQKVNGESKEISTTIECDDNAATSNGKKETDLFQLDLHLPDVLPALRDSCEHWGPYVFTNYTPSFKARLDYIFHSSNELERISTLDNPDDAKLSCQLGLPNDIFPSDHIAVCSDFRWTAH